MEVSMRTYRIISRLLRRPFGITSYKNITGTAVKEELNVELLNSFNQDIRAGGVVPVFRRALLFPSRVALQDEVGVYTYAGLHQAATELSKEISYKLVGETEKTISYMCGNNASHVIVQWAIWMTGNIAVPLTPLHPPDLIKYFVNDSNSSLIICTPEYEEILRPISLEIVKPLLKTNYTRTDKTEAENELTDVGRSNSWYGSEEAMIIYTSGTTSKPKGVVWSHQMLSKQIAALHSAWQYSANDIVLHTLPLHHIHGQLNSLNASLAAGARLQMLPSFVSHTVWSRLLGMDEKDDSKVTMFHGVPSMYARLAADHERMFADKRTGQYVRTTLSHLRLMCAGSAPLSHTLYHKWEQISGVKLLERYGMTEVGMALSNPYWSVEDRTVGCVGQPLPGVAARIVAPSEKNPEEMVPLVTVECEEPEMQICLQRLGLSSSREFFVESDNYNWKPPKIKQHYPSKDGTYQGELLLKGPSVFLRYWTRVPQLGSEEFTTDGWFRTGDTVLFADNKFRILGRSSIDIIKTGGYKVSALQVESAILNHTSVEDAAVIGIDHETQGEIVAAVVVLKENTTLTLKELKDEAGKILAPYQLPRTLLVLDEMPRNHMGKLDKKEIKKIVLDRQAKKRRL